MKRKKPDHSFSHCPKCGAATHVVDTVHRRDGVKRKRRCTNFADCGFAFYTMEIHFEDATARLNPTRFENAFQIFLKDYIKTLDKKAQIRFMEGFYF